MNQNEPKKLDIDAVLKSKAKNHYNKIPKVAINYLKRKVHQDELNHIIEIYRDEDGTDFMKACVQYFNLKLNVKGEENIPDTGSFVFVSNHPLGGLDGICLAAVLGEKYDKKIKYLVNDILLNIENLESIFVPVNKHGWQAKDSVRALNEAYESDNQIITFPAGLCSRKQNGQIKDLQWAKSFVTKARTFKRDIIPVHFEGRNSNFFYNLSNLRKKIGVKMNIEMLYLSDEMMKKKNAEFTITFGKPIPWESLNNTKTPLQWAQDIKDSVYKLNQI
ncbi:MAG: 1-acyl-sn-glycerol-3-phosphate acyltransferase [Dysgonamonadaceae bacterium]|nr:1-acyl-sn-glycerol-3-phosphate acyltransferase [Dysgonamonadaceae bacterium]MDD4728795.1 1-acyl-sn-glycerol-3-phosphate acyltransferase [Dysgonamonadaceae bacterium]